MSILPASMYEHHMLRDVRRGHWMPIRAICALNHGVMSLVPKLGILHSRRDKKNDKCTEIYKDSSKNKSREVL